MCRTVPWDTRDEWDVFDDASLMEAVAADGQNMYTLYQGMDLMVHRHRRAPDGSDVRQNWQTDVTPVCRTVPCDTRDEWDMLDDDSLMEAVAADGQNMYKLYQRVVSSDTRSAGACACMCHHCLYQAM